MIQNAVYVIISKRNTNANPVVIRFVKMRTVGVKQRKYAMNVATVKMTKMKKLKHYFLFAYLFNSST